MNATLERPDMETRRKTPSEAPNGKQKQPEYHAALYSRLSREENNEDESISIRNSRKMLMSYAKDKKYKVYDEYVEPCDIIEPTQETE